MVGPTLYSTKATTTDVMIIAQMKAASKKRAQRGEIPWTALAKVEGEETPGSNIANDPRWKFPNKKSRKGNIPNGGTKTVKCLQATGPDRGKFPGPVLANVAGEETPLRNSKSNLMHRGSNNNRYNHNIANEVMITVKERD